MKLYRHIIGVILAFTVLSLSSCQKDDIFSPEENGVGVTVTFSPQINGNIGTRAIGDASNIDQLKVVVFEASDNLVKKFETTKSWDDASEYGIALNLLKGHSYKLLFWAQDSENTAYAITDEGLITVDYTDYTNGGFAKMEEMDAFCKTVSIQSVSSSASQPTTIELNRPLAQLNFADNATEPIPGTHKAVVTYHNIPISYNPFTGGVNISESQDVTFVFEDFPDEILEINNEDFHYVSSNYLFAPADGTLNISATIDFQESDGTTINKYEFTEDEISLETNNKTNVYGSIVEEPVKWYEIDAPEDIIWLSVPANISTLGNIRNFRMLSDVDMLQAGDISSIQLPEGSLFDGKGKTISNFRGNGGLFGEVSNLTVENLIIDGATVSSTDSHVGILANTLKGTSTISNITISNSTVTTSNGSAGGMVGYVVKKTETDRTEELAVSFNNCKLTDIQVSGSGSEGKFVGLLSGYLNNETLTFDSQCSAENVFVADYESAYINANQSSWVEGTIDSKYDGWLGHEKYRRGKVVFNNVRLVPRWDGTTFTAKENLLLKDSESGKYEVYSPFDLAGVRNATASPAALYLMENVDMYGQGPDGKFYVHPNFTKSAANPEYSINDDDNHLKSFDYVDYLDGNNNSICNLSIYSTFNGATTYYGAFILYCRNTTVHKNIKLQNSCTVVPHVVKDNEDKSYGAAFVCNNDCSTYTMENVHAYDCKVFALQKTGTLVGRLGVNSSGNIDNCSVNNCYIENYNCKDHQEDFSGVAKFYTPGEVGGMFGFVEDNITISNCHVRGTTIHAFGQNDQRVLLFFNIPGRHVSKFIGDIRTSENTDGSKDNIEMTNCTVDATTQCTERYDKHNSTYTTIGKVYYVALAGDKKGTVKFDGKSISF